jgi:hypothetical protein
MSDACRRPARAAALVVAFASLAPAATVSAAGFQVLTAGKVAWFENRGDAALNGGVVLVGRDRALQVLYDPTCPAASGVDVEAYLQSTFRDAPLAHVDLDCAKWVTMGPGFRYDDPTGTVRSIRYTRAGLRIEVGGRGFTPIDGPVGFLQVQLRIGDQTLRTRFHNFRRNDGQVVRSRRPTLAAALGEAGFWDVLLGDDASEARQQQVIGVLEDAVRRNAGDGRSHFLLAMIHLYRFGQRVARFDVVSPAARAELAAANDAFDAAVPLLWHDAAGAGDSRVPGFAAAAKYMQGVLENDPTLRAQGLADLDRAVEVNAFFNVFDYIPVLQFLPPGDPVFQRGFALFDAYLNDPETVRCVGTQPEICANAGFAPHNIQGALTLFGDVYAKAGDLAQAERWYGLVNAFPDTATWRFASAVAERTANAAARVALYLDGDPSNDPPMIGAGTEACAVCHNR